MKNRPIPTGNIVTEWEDNILFDADDPDFCNVSSTAVVNVLNNSATASTNLTLGSHSTCIVPPSLTVPSAAAVPPPPPAATAAATILGVAVAAAMDNNGLNGFQFKLPTTAATTTTTTNPITMSLASVHGPQFTDIYSPLGRSSISMSSSLSDLVGSPLEISVAVDNVLTIEELRQHMGSCFTCGVSWTDDHVSLDCSECGGYSLERPCPLCDGQCGVQWKRDFTMSHACGKARWLGVCPSYPESIVNLNQSATTNSAVTATPASCAAVATQLRLAQELCARLEQL